jgi:hypothetical protein
MNWIYRILAIGALIGLLVLAYQAWATHQQGIGEARATTAYNAAITQQKTAAGELLAAETGKANTATAALNAFKLQQEKDDAQNKSTIADLAVRLRTAAGPAGRLRDPNAPGCGGSGSGAPGADPARAGGGAADAAETGGLFSAGATELFQRLTREADDINTAYASCRPDALKIREVLQ